MKAKCLAEAALASERWDGVRTGAGSYLLSTLHEVGVSRKKCFLGIFLVYAVAFSSDSTHVILEEIAKLLPL